MNKDIERILDDVLVYFESGSEEFLDDESIAYQTIKFNIDDFNKLFDYLNNIGPTANRQIFFPEKRKYFIYKDTKIIWRTLSGQGTACQLLPVKDYGNWPDEWPMVWDSEFEVVL